MTEQLLFDFLKKHNIKYQLFEHQPVFVCEDKPVVTTVDGVPTTTATVPQPHFKTLFLKDKNGTLFLVSVIEDKRIDLNALSVALGCGRFSFGKADEMLEYLKLTPGSVTPFGLLFDKQNKITFVLDEDSLHHATVSFHPMKNDKTVVMSPQMFLECMEKMGHTAKIMTIPTKDLIASS